MVEEPLERSVRPYQVSFSTYRPIAAYRAQPLGGARRYLPLHLALCLLCFGLCTEEGTTINERINCFWVVFIATVRRRLLSQGSHVTPHPCLCVFCKRHEVELTYCPVYGFKPRMICTKDLTPAIFCRQATPKLPSNHPGLKPAWPSPAIRATAPPSFVPIPPYRSRRAAGPAHAPAP